MSDKIKCKNCGDDHYLLGKVIKLSPENPHLCSNCVERPLKIAEKKFIESLSDEQKKLFVEYNILNNHRTSLIILD